MGALDEPERRPGMLGETSPASARIVSSDQCVPVQRPKRRHLHLPFARLLTRRLVVCSFLLLVLFADIIAAWPVIQPSNAFAMALTNPNPALTAPAWLNSSASTGHARDLGQYVAPAKQTVQASTPHAWPVSMKPARLILTAAAQHFVGSDGQLEVDIPAQSLDMTQFTSGITLAVTQVKPGGGGLTSSQIFFGTYEFQFFDGQGHVLSNVQLVHPFTLHYHLLQNQQALLGQGQKLFALSNAVQGSATPPVVSTQQASTNQSVQMAVTPQTLTNYQSTLAYATGDTRGLNWSVQSSFLFASTSTGSSSGKQSEAQATPSAFAVPASSITFGTAAPQATWGKPADFQVGLNSGGLNYSYPLNIPPGPGGFQPSLSLAYSSGSVDGNYNVQTASPWVGQGWSLDLGSISWSQENVTPNQAATNENVWHISDPSGLGGQLVPPDQTYTTIGTIKPTASQLHSSTTIWHTAPESHAKVQEYSPDGTIQCWRAYLPSGVMEEFGCTSDSRQSYKDDSGNSDIYSWNLDLMIDPSGNQVHISYQQDSVSGTIRDAVLSHIQYDDPTCHQTTGACSSWHPQVDIQFDASTSVSHLLNGGCGSGTSSARCDAPADLSGSGGLAAPKVTSSYVLNDVQVKVNSNLLHEYVLSYNQGGNSSLTDPSTGQAESAAGYLTLGKIQEEGVGGATLNAPVITVAYSQQWEHYSDLFTYATPSTNCSPYSNAPRDGSGGPCFLWAQTWRNFYISNLDNGEGWNESVTWKEAHSNTWGVDSGNYNDAFNCSTTQTTTNVCGTADDKNWSHVVVASRTATSNGVPSTWTYSYYLITVNASIPGMAASTRTCHGGCESYDWGNQNDNDYADYYNGSFQSFAQVKVIQPDLSSQIDTYGATNGWGLYSTSLNCSTGGTCVAAPYSSNTGPVLSGKQLIEQDYDTNGNLLKQMNTTWQTNCPPPGVAGSANAPAQSPGGTFLFSQLDHNNPVMVCDPRSTQVDTYTVDGIATSINTSNLDARVLHTTTTTTYDGSNCGSNYTSGYDYGNVSKVDKTANDVGGQHLVSATMTCPHDSIGNLSGTFLTDLPAQMQTQDGSGTSYGCSLNYYGANTSATVAPSLANVTRTDAYTGYTTGCSGSIVTTSHTFDLYGNGVTNTDADGHLGCTSGASQYSACATYDTMGVHLLTGTNAKNQTTTYEYDQDAGEAGFGEWLMSTTDENGQTTTYAYDALGRVVSVTRPGDSPSSPTVTYAYNNTCTAGSTKPCLEIDTSTRFTVGGPLSTKKDWYDGWGNLVETQTPGPNLFSKVPAIPSELITYTVYDNMGRATTKSLPYAVAATAGLGYVAPDLNQARTVTKYDSEGRSLGATTYGNATTIMQSASISYTLALGVPTISSESTTPYEQTITLDAYNHQSISYADGFGRTRYSQVFNGTASPYTVVRSVGTTYDVVGNTLSTQTYDSTGTVKASYTATYDGLKRLTGYNDSDLGSCQNTPMPGDCSSSTDTAWKYTYDADGNGLSQTDPRNQSKYTTYDALDRPLCSALSASNASSCSGTVYAVFFYDGYTNASTPSATFPSGCVAPTGSYASDPISRKTAEAFIGTGGAGSGWRCYGYDQRGQDDQSALSVTTPDAGTVTQTVNMLYNDGGEVTTLIYPNGEKLTSTYDINGKVRSEYFGDPSTPNPVQYLAGQVNYTNAGQVSGMAIGGSAAKGSTPTALFTTGTTYDNMQRPLSDSLTEAGQTVWKQTRAYDNAGNVLGLSTTIPTSGGGAATENEAFCYDALNRLVWAGNSGTPSGGDHCMAPPTGTTLTTYTQAYTYDNLDRTTSGSAGTYTYGNANQVHAATSVSSIPNPYAAYDAMGNMTCRNVDTTTGHTCAGTTPTGAAMSYDTQGQLASWSASSGTVGSAHYLYDAEGNRVLTNSANASSTTDTINFDGYTQTVLTGGTTTTTNYYNLSGGRVAQKTGSTLTYLQSDLLGSNTVALNSTGQVSAIQHYSPYGTMDYTWGSMPTSYSYTGQRLDSQTGLVYYNFRYYDSLTGRFVRGDNVQNNINGMDPYAYVGDSPETKNDPSGHCPWCIGAIVGGLIGAAVATVSIVHAVQTNTFSAGTIGHAVADIGMGAVDGALITSGVGTVAGAALLGTLVGGATGVVADKIDPKHNDGIQGVFESAAMGGITNVLASGLGNASLTLFPKAATSVGSFFMRAGTQGLIQGAIAGAGNLIQQGINVTTGAQDNWDVGSFLWSTGTAGLLGSLTQGLGDGVSSYLRIPPFAKGIAANAPGLLNKMNSVTNIQNVVSAISQNAAQAVYSYSHGYQP